MSKHKLIPIGIRIPKRFLHTAKKLSAQEGITFSHFVRRSLAREFMARQVKP